MKLDIQQINHNYVTRMVIFSVFLFKNHRKEEKAYQIMITNFLRRKVGYKIDLKIECGPKFSLEDQRELVIENLLNDEEFDHMKLVVATFKTALKEVNIQIDLNKEEKYEHYLYS